MFIAIHTTGKQANIIKWIKLISLEIPVTQIRSLLVAEKIEFRYSLAFLYFDREICFMRRRTNKVSQVFYVYLESLTPGQFQF